MFKIKSKDSNVMLDTDQLAQMLVARSIAAETADMKAAIPQIALAIAKSMEDRGLLKNASPIEILALGMGTGYYLNTFLRKNDVQIEEQSAPSSYSDNSSSAPSSSGSSH